jgi:hypothetical protein
MRQAQEVERVRPSLSSTRSVSFRHSAKLDEPRLLRVGFQCKFPQAILQVCQEALGVLLVLEADNCHERVPTFKQPLLRASSISRPLPITPTVAGWLRSHGLGTSRLNNAS